MFCMYRMSQDSALRSRLQGKNAVRRLVGLIGGSSTYNPENTNQGTVLP